MHWSARPFPVSSGGLTSAAAFRSLRGPPQTSVRQPDLGLPPRMGGLLTGFGTGASAGIRNHGSDADQSQGLLIIRCGPNPGTSGAIQINFAPLTPTNTTYWVNADWGIFALNAGGSILQITWAGSRPLLPFEHLALAYQWAVST